MNIITISNFDQFSLIINDSLCLSGDQSEEIYHNMWCITLEDNFIKSIKIQQLEHFISNLIENRKQQLKHINYKKNVVFYMWFDQQALQLRFNIITGDAKSLPFGCTVRLNNTFESILNNFITTVKDVSQHGDQIEFFNNQDEDDEDEEEYVLDVFVKKLKTNIEFQ
jgi:hypothetical protein